MTTKEILFMDKKREILPGARVAALVIFMVLLCSFPVLASDTPALSLEADDLFAEYESDPKEPSVPDPLYWFNYSMYHFNDKLYFWGLKPLAQGYKFVAPVELRRGINNFFYNILFPVRFVNTLLQGKITSAGQEFSIFMINTMGSLGFERIAQEKHGFKDSREDLGQTLGSYGLGQGFYLVLPFLGPSSLRDFVGKAGDYFLSPTGYMNDSEVKMGLTALDVVNGTSLRIGDYEALKESAFDPYISLKDAYLQLRQNRVEK